jgi:hypothetical protein
METLQQLQSGQLIGAQKLKLSCGLTTFPHEILDLSDTLEILDLSGNRLAHLPDDFGRLQKLKIAFFSDNEFTELPVVLSQCACLEMVAFKSNKISSIPEQALASTLRWLILTNNRLTTIPSTISRCVRLQKLMLAGNALTYLPPAMADCQNLQLIRISANQFTEIPSWLFSLPQLSWLAFAANPCSSVPQTSPNLAEISWNELMMAEHLGEGASGMISKALWQDKAQKEVAVKVFKGQVTSDGLPDDEIYACMAAGVHAHLVKVFGKIDGHPEEKQGLVLELIPASFKNLGDPPSFETCTRDTYLPGTVFSISKLVQIATAIASVAAHLHDLGIMHGDLYAHNILLDHADTLLGDFGAATFYNKAYSIHAPAIERLEVRAFGCLLEDLLERIDPNQINNKIITAFTQLKQDCMQPKVLQRPCFTAICERIAGFQSFKEKISLESF